MKRTLTRTGLIALTAAAALLFSACRFKFSLNGSTEDDDPPLTRTEYGETTESTEEPVSQDDPGSLLPGGLDGFLNANWPDNELTKRVPKPEFKILTASEDEDSVTVVFSGAGLDEIKAYAEKLKALGFTEDAEMQDENLYGTVIYSYTAYDGDGCCVQLSFTAGNAALQISR